MPSEIRPSYACLDPLQLQYVNLAAQIIQSPPDGAGLIVALQSALECLQTLVKVRSIPSLEVYLNQFTSSLTALVSWDQLPAQMRARPDAKSYKNAYRLWLELRTKSVAPELAEPLRQALGVVFGFHLSKRKEVSEATATVCLALVRAAAGESSSKGIWRQLVERLKLNDQSLAKLSQELEHEPARNFIARLAGMLDIQLHPLKVEASAMLGGTGQQDGNGRLQSAADSTENRPVAALHSEDEIERPGSLVRWQAERAVRSSMALIAGLSDWNMLDVPGLKRVIDRIKESGRERSDGRYWLLAIISLITSLPPRLALQLPLITNDDMWIDLVAGGIWWNRAKLVKQEDLPEQVVAGGNKPGQHFFIPFPNDIGCELLALAALPRQLEQQTLFDLLFNDLDLDNVRRAYGRFLRGGEEEQSEHVPYAARFAYSFGAAMLAATRNQIATGICTLDLRHLAGAEPQYLCIEKQFLHQAFAVTYASLGLDAPRPYPGPDWVGSLACPRKSVVLDAGKSLNDSIARSCTELQSCTVDQVDDHWNKLVICRAAAFCLGVGHRGHKFHRVTVGDLYAVPGLANLRDKQTSLLLTRIVPLSRSMRSLLAGHRADIVRLGKILRHADRAAALRLTKIGNGETPSSSAFFKIKRTSKGRIAFLPLKTADVRAALQELQVAVNGGRHYLISEAVALGMPAVLLRTITGHSRGGGQPFHFAGGLAPADMYPVVAQFLEAIHQGFLPREWSSIRGTVDEPIALPLTRRALKTESISESGAARRPMVGPAFWHKRSDPFSRYTLLHHAFAMRVITELCRGAPGLSPWAAFMVSLVFVDGVNWPERLQLAWKSATPDGIRRIKQTPIVTWTNATKSQDFVPLQPVTAAFLDQGLGIQKVPSLDQCQSQSMEWLRLLESRNQWSSDVQEMLHEVCAVARSSLTLEMPPWVQTADRPEMDAAKLSMTSLARIAFGKPALNQGPLPIRVKRTLESDRSPNTLGYVCAIANHMGSIKKKHGEEDRRAALLLEKLQLWRSQAWAPSGEALGVVDWLEHEYCAATSNEDRLDVASTATYLSKARPGLLGRGHPLEWYDSDWFAFISKSLEGKAGGYKQQTVSVLKRFFRFYWEQGAAIPSEAWEALNEVEIDYRVVRHASSTYISRGERDAVANLVKESFEEDTLECEQAFTYTHTCSHACLRANEAKKLAIDDVHPLGSEIVVIAKGFSELKGGETSRRRIPVSPDCIRQLTVLSHRIATAYPGRSSLFLQGTQEENHEVVDAIEQEMTWALRSITGEEGARGHCLRASNAMDRAIPLMETWIAELRDGTIAASRTSNGRISAWLRTTRGEQDWIDGNFDGELPGSQELEELANEWAVVTRTAMEAGHHPISCIKYYLAGYPVMMYAERRRWLHYWLPKKGLDSRINHLSNDNFRQIVSRYAEGINGKDAWHYLLKRLDCVERLRSIETLLAERSVRDQLQSGRGCHFTDNAPAHRLHFATLLLAGATFHTALDLSGVDGKVARNVEQDVQALNGVALRLLGSSKALDKALPTLTDPSSRVIMDHLCSELDAALLTHLLTVLGEGETLRTTPEADVVATVRQFAAILPPSMTLSVLPEQRHDAVALKTQLLVIDGDIIVKEASKNPSRRFRLLARPRRISGTSARAEGEATSLIRAVLAAQLVLVMGQKGKS